MSVVASQEQNGLGEGAWLEDDEDEDGLGSTASPTSLDELYLVETAADDTKGDNGNLSQLFQRWKIDHNPGDFKYSCKRAAQNDLIQKAQAVADMSARGANAR